MADRSVRLSLPLCPSARPHMDESVVFGVVGEAGGRSRLGYLAEPMPVSRKVLLLCGAATPTEVFRFAAPCAGRGCQHFDGSNCRLATRVVRLLPTVVEELPPCRIRPDCRWWRQEGRPACLRCPQIVSEAVDPSDLLRLVAGVEAPVAPVSDGMTPAGGDFTQVPGIPQQRGPAPDSPLAV